MNINITKRKKYNWLCDEVLRKIIRYHTTLRLEQIIDILDYEVKKNKDYNLFNEEPWVTYDRWTKTPLYLSIQKQEQTLGELFKNYTVSSTK